MGFAKIFSQDAISYFNMNRTAFSEMGIGTLSALNKKHFSHVKPIAANKGVIGQDRVLGLLNGGSANRFLPSVVPPASKTTAAEASKRSSGVSFGKFTIGNRSSFKEAGSKFLNGMQRFAFNKNGLSNAFGKTMVQPIAMGAFGGASGAMGYGLGGAMFPGHSEGGGVMAGAWQGAKYGAALGAMGVIGGGIGKTRWRGNWSPVGGIGKMMKSANESWATRGALMVGSAAAAGNASITRPVNKGY